MKLKTNLFDIPKRDSFRISYDQESADYLIATKISSMIPLTNQPIIIFCIGTDRSTGDSLGPIIGSKVSEMGHSYFHVYGTLDEPIHAVNLNEKAAEVYKRYENPFIIGIDASLGKVKSVGLITIDEGPLKPGAGVNKELLPIGDMNITGIVNVGGSMEFFVLQNTRLGFVMNIANTIARGICKAELFQMRRIDLSHTTNVYIHNQTP